MLSREALQGVAVVALLIAGGLGLWSPTLYDNAWRDTYFSTPGGIALAEMAGDAAGWRAALLPGIGAGLLVLTAACLFVVAAVRNRAAQ